MFWVELSYSFLKTFEMVKESICRGPGYSTTLPAHTSFKQSMKSLSKSHYFICNLNFIAYDLNDAFSCIFPLTIVIEFAQFSLSYQLEYILEALYRHISEPKKNSELERHVVSEKDSSRTAAWWQCKSGNSSSCYLETHSSQDQVMIGISSTTGTKRSSLTQLRVIKNLSASIDTKRLLRVYHTCKGTCSLLTLSLSSNCDTA